MARGTCPPCSVVDVTRSLRVNWVGSLTHFVVHVRIVDYKDLIDLVTYYS